MNTNASSEGPRDLEPVKPNQEANPSSKGSASLEADLERANRRISRFNAERLLFVIVLIIIWDAHTFKSYDGWAPFVGLMVLEILGIYILAWRLDMHQVIQLAWGMMRSYGGRNAGDTPEDTASSTPKQ